MKRVQSNRCPSKAIAWLATSFALLVALLGSALGAADPDFRRGDTNADGVVDIADSVLLHTYLFRNGPAPSCVETGDLNEDYVLDISDTIRGINYLFLAGPLPEFPGPDTCGADPIGFFLTPCVYNACGTPPAVLPNAHFQLRINAANSVPAAPGTTVRFYALAELCWDASFGQPDAWSIGLRRDNPDSGIRVVAAETLGTDAEPFADASWFRRSDVFYPGPNLFGLGFGAFSAIYRGPTTEPVPPLPTSAGPSCSTILRLTLEARAPDGVGECINDTLRYEDEMTQLTNPPLSFTRPVKIRVATNGQESYLPVLPAAFDIAVCATNDPQNTPAGPGVSVDAGAGISVTFGDVLGPGATTGVLTGSGKPASQGFQVLDAGNGALAYYAINTTATYTGDVEVCIPYTPPPGMDEATQASAIKLYVCEPGQVPPWRDVTTSVDTVGHRVCGLSHLSDFALFSSVPLAPVPVFRRGDANTDGTVDLSDALQILTALFIRHVTVNCADAYDANDDGGVDIADCIRILIFLYTQGSKPLPDPGPFACGQDPVQDSLPECTGPEYQCR